MHFIKELNKLKKIRNVKILQGFHHKNIYNLKKVNHREKNFKSKLYKNSNKINYFKSNYNSKSN